MTDQSNHVNPVPHSDITISVDQCNLETSVLEPSPVPKLGIWQKMEGLNHLPDSKFI